MRAWSPVAFAIVAGVFWWPQAAWARKAGVAAADCNGCHSSGRPPTVTLSASPMTPGVNDAITLTVTVSQTNGPVAGFYLTTADMNGTFEAFEAGTGLKVGGVTHTMPRTGANGFTTFQARWTTTVATGVLFQAYAVSANNNNSPSGDGANSATLSLAVGCAGILHYSDQDTDGYGTSDPSFPVFMDCGPRAGYATKAGDCADFDAAVHPSAPEMCNGKDDNCNGQIDEDVVYQPYCQDKDGDGHGVPGATSKMDCAPSPGFGDCGGDCDDQNAAIHPGAAEICDGRDNNCDGNIDEGVRPTCGLGWCRRYVTGCTTTCTPGPPLAETCNLFDDDCDGVVDNGTDAQLCGAPGLACRQGLCVPADSVVGSGGGGGTGDPGTGAGGSAGVGAGATGRGGCQLLATGDLPAGVDLTLASLALVSLLAGRPSKRPRGPRKSQAAGPRALPADPR